MFESMPNAQTVAATAAGALVHAAQNQNSSLVQQGRDIFSGFAVGMCLGPAACKIMGVPTDSQALWVAICFTVALSGTFIVRFLMDQLNGDGWKKTIIYFFPGAKNILFPPDVPAKPEDAKPKA